MEKALKIRDLTLRDGQQSLFATRLRQKSIDRLLPLYRDAGFYIMEVWGGAVPDTLMRYLDESPWDRLRACAEEMRGVSLLAALSRGRNLIGYVPYPDYILEGFYKEAIANGVNIMRIYDGLNDLDNIRESIRMINDLGGIPDAALCYSIDPKEEKKIQVKKKGFFSRLFNNTEEPEVKTEKIFTDSYFVKKAKEMERMGAKIVTLKDMAGLATPSRIFSLMPKLKMTLKVPVDFHIHCTLGNGLAAVVTAIIKGVDIVDTNIWWFGGGEAAPALELVWIFCNKLGIPIDVNMESVAKIRAELKDIRKQLSDFDIYKDRWPHDFEEYYSRMPKEIDAEFDRAIEAAGMDNEEELLDACHKIESYFGFPETDEMLRDARIPAGVYSRIVAELKEINAEDGIEEALLLIPKIRRDAGLVPLVTPVGQIIGSQAVALIKSRRNGLPDYTDKNHDFVSLIKGEYGKTPRAIDPVFRAQVTGSPEERPYDVSSFREPSNPELAEFGSLRLAKNDEEFLLLDILPTVAADFLRARRKSEYESEKTPTCPTKFLS